jgi:hypothetical protein
MLSDVRRELMEPEQARASEWTLAIRVRGELLRSD